MSLRYFSVSLILAGFAAAVPEVEAQCNQCSQCCKDQNTSSNGSNCCRPNRCKIVYRGNAFGGGLVGAAPPQGFAVASVPALMFHTPSFAATPAMIASPAGVAGASVTQSNLSDRDVQRLADAIANRRPNAASADVNSTPNPCDDPCGSITKLRNDVDKLILVTERLTTIVENLPKNKPSGQ